MRIAIGVVVMLGGCSSELTCQLLADPTNCWATAAASAAACMPAHATPATLSADRASCTFSDGVRVVFDGPLPTEQLALDHLSFTVQSAGAPCATFSDSFHNHMELSTGGHDAISQLDPDGTFELQCGGTTYETSFQTLFTCQPPAVAPTDGFTVASDLVTFSLSSVATPGELFRCTLPSP